MEEIQKELSALLEHLYEYENELRQQFDIRDMSINEIVFSSDWIKIEYDDQILPTYIQWDKIMNFVNHTQPRLKR